MPSAPPIALVSGKDVLEGVGGHETYVRAHAMAAQRLGLEPHIFCVGKPGRTETDYGFVHHVRAPGPVVAQARPLARAITTLGGEDHVLGIHGFALWSAAGAMAARRIQQEGLRAVAVCNAYATREYEVAAMQHGLTPHHGHLNRLRYRAWLQWIRAVDNRQERWGYEINQTVFVNYDSTAQILRKAYGDHLAIQKITYATTEAFNDAGRATPPTDPPLILCVSRQDPRKGVDVLINALAELHAEGIPFRAKLIGPGRLLEPHRKLVSDLHISDLVDLPGQVKDVHPIFNETSIFVLPSLAEASGSVSVLEALQTTTPVVATNVDGLPEDLTNGKDALLVPPGDKTALATALKTLLQDKKIRTEMGKNARATYETRFSAEALVTALRQAYESAGILQKTLS